MPILKGLKSSSVESITKQLTLTPISACKVLLFSALSLTPVLENLLTPIPAYDEAEVGKICGFQHLPYENKTISYKSCIYNLLDLAEEIYNKPSNTHD